MATRKGRATKPRSGRATPPAGPAEPGPAAGDGQDRPSGFQRLWAIAERLGNPEEVLRPIGLGLLSPEGSSTFGRYWATPADMHPFAQAGGGGVHFSFLKLKGHEPDDGPVVMTVPLMADAPSHVLGENLAEFLALGCTFGYAALEQLAYKPEEAVRAIETQPVTQQPGASLLETLRTELDLKPWTDVGSRLAALRRKYQRHLKLEAG